MIPFLIFLLFLQGCADYTSLTRKAREEYYSGKCSEAAQMLEAKAHEEGVDQLLYLFDRATALHCAGQYEEAIKEFRAADKIADISDYTSLSTEAATLVSNDRIIHYKGEDFEKVLINQYLAIDYLLLGKFEDAQVENRRVNRKLYLMITEGKRKYELNPMAKYLSAIIFEMEGQLNDAYIDYKSVMELLPGFPYLKDDLYRAAWKSNIREDMDRWQKAFDLSKDDIKRIKDESKKPEIIIVAEVGQSPEKRPHPNWKAIPKYYPRPNSVESFNVEVSEVEGATQGTYSSHKLFDIESTAIQNLDDKFSGLLAKRIGGVVVKEGIGIAVDEKVSPILGGLLRLGLHAIDQADLRSWLTLPRDFQIVRIRVDEGRSYLIKIPGQSIEKRVDIPKGKKNFKQVVSIKIG